MIQQTPHYICSRQYFENPDTFLKIVLFVSAFPVGSPAWVLACFSQNAKAVLDLRFVSFKIDNQMAVNGDGDGLL